MHLQGNIKRLKRGKKANERSRSNGQNANQKDKQSQKSGRIRSKTLRSRSKSGRLRHLKAAKGRARRLSSKDEAESPTIRARFSNLAERWIFQPMRKFTAFLNRLTAKLRSRRMFRENLKFMADEVIRLNRVVDEQKQVMDVLHLILKDIHDQNKTIKSHLVRLDAITAPLLGSKVKK